MKIKIMTVLFIENNKIKLLKLIYSGGFQTR